MAPLHPISPNAANSPSSADPGHGHQRNGAGAGLNGGLGGAGGGSLNASSRFQAFASPFELLGQGQLAADDMKRGFDTSSLPSNPLNGLHPTIDPLSALDAIPSSAPAGMTAFQKKPRPLAYGRENNNIEYVPGVPQQPLSALPGLGGIGGAGALPFSAMQTPPISHSSVMPNVGLPSLPNSPFSAMTPGFTPMSPFAFSPQLLSSPVQELLSPLLNPHEMTGNYGPAAAAAAATAALAGNSTGRTVYVGALPPDASVDELLNLVRFGPIERVHLVKEKSCVFISFLNGATAAAFHADAQVKRLALHGQALRIGWGQESHLSPPIAVAVRDSHATRNVYIGKLDENENEATLRDYFSREFGPIDQVKVVRDKNCGFIHFLSIAVAMKVVAELPKRAGWEGKPVNYGKDRCAYVPKAQQAAVQQAQQSAVQALMGSHIAGMPGSPFMAFPQSPQLPGTDFGTPNLFSSPLFANVASPIFAQHREPLTGHNIRTVYLGNLAPETTYEDLCNNIRAGILQQIRFLRDKNVAFVTFVDPAAARMFFEYARGTNLTIHQHRLNVGWAKSSDNMPEDLQRHIEAGACRNVYIGKIPDFEEYTADKLREDFEGFGDIEQINFLSEKNCAFVNFASIASAIKAVEGIKANPDYADLAISYGKDRCGNVRPPGERRPHPQRNVSGTTPKAPDASSNDASAKALQDSPMEQESEEWTEVKAQVTP